MLAAQVTTGALLAVRGLVTEYRPRTAMGGAAKSFRAVDRVGFDVSPGEAVGLVGESGCGKSSVARTILRLVPAAAGSAVFDGRDLLAAGGAQLRALRSRLQIVFQNPYDSLDPRMRVLAIVREPLDVAGRGRARGERADRAIAALAEVGLGAEFARRFPHELSGGQRQRVGIARALVTDPALVVCDEPVSSLDISVQAQVLALLDRLRRERNLAMLFISHDIRVIRFLCDRALVMYRGRIMESGPVDLLTDRPAHPYTKLLLASVPSLDPARRRGDAPVEAAIDRSAGGGCPFASRCARVRDDCTIAEPSLTEIRPGHFAACVDA